MKNLAAQRKHAARKFFILHSQFFIFSISQLVFAVTEEVIA